MWQIMCYFCSQTLKIYTAMKKMILLCAALFVVSALSAQQKVYCQITKTNDGKGLFSNSIAISIDYGQTTSTFSDDRLVDENGDNIVFNSMVDAMNYMSALGWDFEQAYTTVSGSDGDTSSKVYWILSKTVEVDENATEGLKSAEAYIEEQRSTPKK